MSLDSNPSQPRTGNTGVICAPDTLPEILGNVSSENSVELQPELRLEFLVDWLQGTYPSSNRTQVIGLCRSYFGGGDFEEQPHGIRYYRRCFKNPAGVVLGIEQRLTGTDSVHLNDYLELRADVVGLLPGNLLRNFMSELKRLCFRPSRIDVTMDVFNAPFEVWDVYKAFNDGNIKGFRDAGQLHTKGRNASKGLSFSLGNRGSAGSGKHLVFYDKKLESKGERDCLRCELSLYSHYADQTFDLLAEVHVSDWAEIMKGLIVWSVDFIDRSSPSGARRQACRSSRLFWWEQVVQQTVPIYLAAPRVVNSIQKMQQWVSHQVGPVLSTLRRALGFLSPRDFRDWLMGVLEDGDKRFRARHRAALEAFEAHLGLDPEFRRRFCLKFQDMLRAGASAFSSVDEVIEYFCRAGELGAGIEELSTEFWDEIAILLHDVTATLN